MRVIKKIFRSAMCLYGYFNINAGEVIFASPKINNSVVVAISECIPDIQDLLNKAGLNYNVRLLGNDDFDEKIMQPVIAATALIADTSELFMRSMQMYNMFSQNWQKPVEQLSSKGKTVEAAEPIAITNIDGLDEMKIGVLVRSTLSKMLSNHEISKEEIELMQTAEYSKETFHIQYPLLRKASLSNGEKVLRYWAGAVEAYGEQYFICSEWYEVPQNNDRPYFMKWLGLHMRGEKSRVTKYEAIIEAFKALGGTRGIEEIRNWVCNKYGKRWSDDFGTTMADMVKDGNKSTKVYSSYRVLKKDQTGKYSLLNGQV
jgi:hypothetical protein